MNKLGKHVNRFTLVLIPAIFCLVAVQSAPAKEPVYNGKPLSDWLVLNLTGDSVAQEAIRQIGTSGIPTLINILGAKDSNRRSVLRRLKSEQLKQEFREKDSNLADLRNLAVGGFAVLGTNAEPAVPRLTRLFQDPETCVDAARVLTQVGSKGFFMVTNALFSDEGYAGAVVLALQNAGGDPKVITQLLIYALKNSDEVTRGNAARFLKGKDAALAIPALLPMLDETNDYPLRGAIIALGSYGSAARAAAPKLLSIFTNAVVNPDRQLARSQYVAIMDALGNIDRNTAIKATEFISNCNPTNLARYSYTRTRLLNGQELIAGGYIFARVTNYDLSSAELYDPVTGKWTETGKMNFARYGHTATLRPDGKVLVMGGSITTSVNIRQTFWDGEKLVEKYAPERIESAVTNSELYDPDTEKWTVITNK